MKTKLSVLSIALLLCVASNIKGQGCSDAGFCTLNALKTEESAEPGIEQKNKLRAGFALGKADHAISIQTGYLEYSRFLGAWSVNTKLTYLRQDGSLTTSAGLGDLYLSTNYLFVNGIVLTGGIKIPLNDGNAELNGLALPMDYQTSLGTYDLILGIAYNLKSFYFSLGLQQVLSQNSNTFLTSNYPPGSEFQNFHSTNQYIRKSDIMFRLSYQAAIGEKFVITPGLLPIYHLANDEFTDTDGVQKQIDGSQGLTLNGTLFFAFKMNDSNTLELNFGMPFITRKARPDGLTREYMLGLEYKLAF